jgi:NMD protein affecting ribosome stability and mRNA decay
MYDEGTEIHTFTNPKSSTVHIHRGTPDQRTVEFPDRPDIAARAYCGYRLHVREGDLTPHQEAVRIRADQRLCGRCVRAAPAKYTATHEADA